jgi:hypothetical protein
MVPARLCIDVEKCKLCMCWIKTTNGMLFITKNIQQTPSVSFYIASSPVKMASVKILAAPLEINLTM